MTPSVLIDVFCVVFLADGPRARPWLRMYLFVRALFEFSRACGANSVVDLGNVPGEEGGREGNCFR